MSAFEVCAACTWCHLDWNSWVNHLFILLINVLFTNTPVYPAFVTLRGNNTHVKTKKSMFHIQFIYAPECNLSIISSSLEFGQLVPRSGAEFFIYGLISCWCSESLQFGNAFSKVLTILSYQGNLNVNNFKTSSHP